MSEKGILFSGEMIRAILEGRKTQTRRIIKPQPQGRLCYRMMASHGAGKWGYLSPMAAEMWGEKYDFLKALSEKERDRLWNPPFHAGDLLYVRETWAYFEAGEIIYKADYVRKKYENIIPAWRPSIHLPKSSSRIWLKVKKVGTERLQEISEEDAKAEGISTAGLYPLSVEFGNDIYRNAFSRLWDSLYGKGSWTKNPWVWRIQFERIKSRK